MSIVSVLAFVPGFPQCKHPYFAVIKYINLEYFSVSKREKVVLFNFEITFSFTICLSGASEFHSSIEVVGVDLFQSSAPLVLIVFS